MIFDSLAYIGKTDQMMQYRDPNNVLITHPGEAVFVPSLCTHPEHVARYNSAAGAHAGISGHFCMLRRSLATSTLSRKS